MSPKQSVTSEPHMILWELVRLFTEQDPIESCQLYGQPIRTNPRRIRD